MKGNFHPLARILRHGPPSLASLGLLAPFAALANPSGADVVHGNAGISTPTPGGMVIDQTSQNAIINWQQFSIGDGEYVLFNQPSASAAVLNRVLGGSPSEILGNLSANGRVFLINPAGVMFGAGSQVDVGSLVVSTHDIADQDFIDGRYVFSGSSTAGIRNDGRIEAADGGFVVLSADQVVNSGLIQARLGEVVLAAGSGMRFELDTGGLVNFQVDADAASAAAGVENLGDIVAQGGNVLLTARVARDLAASAVNNSGRVVATGVEERDGAIYLVASGGDIANSGLLDVSGGDRGTVQIRGDGDITLASGSRIEAQGAGGGQVLAVADGTLLHAEGSSVDVSATATTGTGGFLELSGHERLLVRGDVTLGDRGHLLLDPTDLTIGDEDGDTMTFAALENLLQSNAGAWVELIATDSILIREREGAQTLNGRNANGGGAGLFLGIGESLAAGSTAPTGPVIFAEPTLTPSTNYQRGEGGTIQIGDVGSDDTLDIAGDIMLITGTATGDGDGQIAAHAALRAGGAIDLTAVGQITTGALTAGVPPSPTGAAGEGTAVVGDGISVTPGGASGSTHISIRNDSGSITTGALSGGSVSIAADTGDVLVRGDIETEDYTSVYAGGSIGVDGSIASQGEVDLSAGGDGENAGVRVDGDINAGTAAWIHATTGDIELASVTVTGSSGPDEDQRAELWLNASQGRIHATGSLEATSEESYASVEVYGGSGVKIDGDVIAEGTAPVYDPRLTENALISDYGEAVDVYINSSGDVEIGGVIRAHGQARTIEFPDENGSSTTSGSTAVQIDGRNISLGGLDVSGVGNATVWIYSNTVENQAEPNTVRINGQATVRAEAGVQESYAADGSSTTLRTGVSTLQIYAEGSDVSTQGISVTGPLAGVAMHAGTLNLGSGENGSALDVTAFSDAENRNFMEWRQPTGPDTPDTVTQSDYGLAVVVLAASGGDDSTPGIAIDGDVAVEGPSALATLLSEGRVAIEGNVDINGLGYTTSGDWDVVGETLGQLIGTNLLFGVNVPYLTEGTATWGESALSIAGYLPFDGELPEDTDELPMGGDVLIGGDVSVTGVGEARVQVFARSFESGNVSISASQGSIAGSRNEEIDGEISSTRYIGGDIDGESVVTGEARYSAATFTFHGDDSALSRLDSAGIRLDGGLAQASVSGVREVYLGGLEVLGGRGESAPVYAERIEGLEGGPFETRIVGATSVADIDVGAEGGIEIAGNTTVEGTGIAGLSLRGGTVQLGDVSVTADRGSYVNTNPAYVSDELSFGDAAVHLATYDGSRVTATSLSVTAADHVHLGTALDASGDVSIQAGGSIDDVLPAGLLDFEHPLSGAVGGGTAAEDLPLSPIDIAARNVSLSFTQSPALAALTLAADETLSLDGNGSMLGSNGALSLSGGTINLTELTIYRDTLTLEAANDLNIVGSTLSYDNGTFSAGGTIRIDNGFLHGNTHSLDADTAIRVVNGSYIGGGEGQAASVTLNGPLIDILGESTLEGSTLSLEATNDLNIVGGSILDYDNGTFSAGGTIHIDHGSLYGNTHSLDADTAIRVENGYIGGGEGSAASVTLNAPLIEVLGDSTIAGDEVALEAGGNLVLGGSIVAEQLSLSAGGSITMAPEQALLIHAGAIDAIAEMIDLTGSELTIGTGAAVNGIDTAFFDEVPLALRPISSGPNAAFIASGPGGVSLGTITLEGGYLFVQAATASAEQFVVPEGRLFYNYRPFDDLAPLDVPTEAGLNVDADDVTLAIGGTGYNGDITILQPAAATVAAKATETHDYVFLTGGSIFGPQSLNTTGEVIVVGGTVVNPEPESPSDPLDEASDVQTIVSELSDPPTVDETFSIGDILIEEESGIAAIIEEFQCR